MKLMLVVNWTRTTLDKIGAKFLSGEDVDPPEGARLLGRWHDISSKQAWLLVEADDAATIQRWTAAWSDFIDWEIYPVVEDEEAAAVVEETLNK